MPAMPEKPDSRSEPHGRKPPGKKLRFFVQEEDGRRGSSWSIETAKNRDDVYLFHREGAKWVKASFHESGQWHHSVMPQGHSQLPEGQSAYFGVSHERPALAHGWWHAARITVDRADLRHHVEQGRPVRDAVIVPTAADRQAVAIDVYIADVDHQTIRVNDAFLIGSLERLGGGIVVVIARGIDLDQPVQAVFASQIVEARRDLAEAGWDLAMPTRIVICGTDVQGGFLREIEIAIDPNSAKNDAPVRANRPASQPGSSRTMV